MKNGTLVHGDATLFVGVSELENEQKARTDEIISFASEKLDGVMVLQFLDSSLVAGHDHLFSAAQNALNAWRGGYSVARSLDVEILRYASGQNQIGVAMDTMGIKETTQFVAAVIVAEDEEKVKDQFSRILEQLGPEVDPSFVPNEVKIKSIMKHFEVTEAELATITTSDSQDERYQALTGCVMSKVSMVALES